MKAAQHDGKSLKYVTVLPDDYNPEIIIAYGAFTLGGFLMGLLIAWLIMVINNA